MTEKNTEIEATAGREASECSDLLYAAKIGAKWMRWWLSENDCECENGHTCGRTERQRELEYMERVIKNYECL